ncbi:hypothetical protein SAMN06298212_10850 [Ruaniaceae bacterium KH17]|nr:hypothetical protein SAMN06298212_10850 [Ruaniaceae bacterium KH17]
MPSKDELFSELQRVSEKVQVLATELEGAEKATISAELSPVLRVEKPRKYFKDSG